MIAARIAWRYVEQRWITSCLAVLCIALAVGTVSALYAIPQALQGAWLEPASAFPVVVGRGDSPSRVMLGALMLDPPAPADLPREAEALISSAPGAGEMIPVSISHAAEGIIVETTRSYFERRLGLVLVSGRYFREKGTSECVVGATIARSQSVAIGDPVTIGRRRLRAVGILRATGTSIDRTVLVSRSADTPFSAAFLVPHAEFDAEALERRLRGNDVRVVVVRSVLRGMVQWMGALDRIVWWICAAIGVLVALMLGVSIHAGLRERTRDLAVLRGIGARPGTLMTALTLETATLGMGGVLLGVALAAAILGALRVALLEASIALEPQLGRHTIAIAAIAFGGVVTMGLVPAAWIYRLDPASALTSVHRAWREILGARGRSRWVKVRFIALLLAVIGPSSVYRAAPQTRGIAAESSNLFRSLSRWDGEGLVPAELQALAGRTIEVEGYVYLPPWQSRSGWLSSFFLIAQDPSVPVHLFHEEHEPETSERIAVELAEPIEPTRYPIRVRGELQVGSRLTAAGSSIYAMHDAKAEVIGLGSD